MFHLVICLALYVSVIITRSNTVVVLNYEIDKKVLKKEDFFENLNNELNGIKASNIFIKKLIYSLDNIENNKIVQLKNILLESNLDKDSLDQEIINFIKDLLISTLFMDNDFANINLIISFLKIRIDIEKEMEKCLYEICGKCLWILNIFMDEFEKTFVNRELTLLEIFASTRNVTKSIFEIFIMVVEELFNLTIQKKIVNLEKIIKKNNKHQYIKSIISVLSEVKNSFSPDSQFKFYNRVVNKNEEKFKEIFIREERFWRSKQYSDNESKRNEVLSCTGVIQTEYLAMYIKNYIMGDRHHLEAFIKFIENVKDDKSIGKNEKVQIEKFLIVLKKISYLLFLFSEIKKDEKLYIKNSLFMFVFKESKECNDKFNFENAFDEKTDNKNEENTFLTSRLKYLLFSTLIFYVKKIQTEPNGLLEILEINTILDYSVSSNRIKIICNYDLFDDEKNIEELEKCKNIFFICKPKINSKSRISKQKENLEQYIKKINEDILEIKTNTDHFNTTIQKNILNVNKQIDFIFYDICLLRLFYNYNVLKQISDIDEFHNYFTKIDVFEDVKKIINKVTDYNTDDLKNYKQDLIIYYQELVKQPQSLNKQISTGKTDTKITISRTSGLKGSTTFRPEIYYSNQNECSIQFKKIKTKTKGVPNKKNKKVTQPSVSIDENSDINEMKGKKENTKKNKIGKNKK